MENHEEFKSHLTANCKTDAQQRYWVDQRRRLKNCVSFLLGSWPFRPSFFMSEPFLHTLGKCDISPMKLYSLEKIFSFKWVYQYIKLVVVLLFIPGYSIQRGRGFWFCKTFFGLNIISIPSVYLFAACLINSSMISTCWFVQLQKIQNTIEILKIN